jgi:hypothetical protein
MLCLDAYRTTLFWGSYTGSTARFLSMFCYTGLGCGYLLVVRLFMGFVLGTSCAGGVAFGRVLYARRAFPREGVSGLGSGVGDHERPQGKVWDMQRV